MNAPRAPATPDGGEKDRSHQHQRQSQRQQMGEHERGATRPWRTLVQWLSPGAPGPGALDSSAAGHTADATPSGAAAFTALRRRLISMDLAVVAIILLILSAAIYAFEARTIMSQVDQLLTSEAQQEAPRALEPLEEDSGGGTEAPYASGSPNLFAVILGPQGQVLLDDDQVQSLGLPYRPATEPVLSGRTPAMRDTITLDGNTFRLYTIPVLEDGRIVAAVQAGTSLTVYDNHLHNLLLILLVLDSSVLVLTGLMGERLVERALAPARMAFARQRQFAAAASHELRTPLAVIRSQAELIAEHEPPTPAVENSGASKAAEEAPGAECREVSEDARGILAEVDYMSRLVSHLLLLARDEHDARAMVKTPVDLSTLVRDSVQTLQPLAQEKGLSLAFASERHGHEASAPVTVYGDADRLRQLVLILLDNAIRYTPAGGKVQVTLRSARHGHLHRGRGGVVELAVGDTGPGIAPEHQPHLFEPFYRASHAAARRGDSGGAGLGLALAHWIVEAHEGQIRVASEPGKGSTFTVTLPLVAS